MPNNDNEGKNLERQLKESEERLLYAQRIARLGFWDLNPITNELYWSDETYRIYGFKPQEFEPSFEKFRSVIHPDDLEFVQKHVDAALQNDVKYNIDFRIVLPSGEIRYVNAQGDVTRDSEGKAIRFIGTQIDITERKNAEEKLKESEEKYRILSSELEQRVIERTQELKESEKKYKNLADELEMILDHIPGLVFFKDTENNFIRVNKYHADAHNLRKEEMEGVSCFDIYPKEQAQAYLDDDLEVINTRKPKLNIVEPWDTPEGTRWALTSKIPYFDENGNVTGIIGLASDITERVNTEKKLKESEERFKYLVSSTPAIIYTAIPYGDYGATFISKNVLEEMGYTPEEFTENPQFWISKVHPDDQDRTLSEASRLQEEGYLNYEYRFKYKDGSYHWLRDDVRLIRDKNGEPIETIGSIIDITERKKAEEKLKESEEKYRKFSERYEMLLESITDGVFALSKDWEYTLVNKLAENLVNMPREKLLGNKIIEIFPGIEQTPFFKTYEEVMNSRKPKRVRDSFILPDGHMGYYEVSVYPITEGILCIGRDITEEVEAEQKLKKSEEDFREAYERAEFYKDLFAHDISNILQNIQSSIGLFSMWRNEPEKIEKVDKLMNIINDQLIRGAKLVSNIRRLSEITETESHVETIDALQILKDAIKFINKSFPEKAIEIEIESQLKDINVKANLLLLDVFENVIFNSIKYNENARIEILTKISREIKNGTKFAKFEFIDNGIGVPDVMKERIFKGISDRKEKIHGMGLGLLLVKRVLSIYNGDIWVEDKVQGDPSQGSNFIILIPEVV